jgi:hypothetical protein
MVRDRNGKERDADIDVDVGEGGMTDNEWKRSGVVWWVEFLDDV